MPPVPIMRMFFISKLLVVHGGQAEAHRLLDFLLPPGVGGVIFLAKPAQKQAPQGIIAAAVPQVPAQPGVVRQLQLEEAAGQGLLQGGQGQRLRRFAGEADAVDVPGGVRRQTAADGLQGVP